MQKGKQDKQVLKGLITDIMISHAAFNVQAKKAKKGKKGCKKTQQQNQ
jgi:hypothetical protein